MGSSGDADQGLLAATDSTANGQGSLARNVQASGILKIGVLHAAKDAVSSAKALVEEQPNTTIFALGVGRHIDQNLVSLKKVTEGQVPAPNE